MKFEVIRNGATVFQTESSECLYPTNVLRVMSRSGYTFRIDDKRTSLDKAIQLTRGGG